MNPKSPLLFVLTIFFPLVLPLAANDFDQWYFDFFRGRVATSGEFRTPDGRHVETCEGTIEGVESPEGTTFTQKGKLTYLKEEKEVTVELVWRKKAKDSYEGVYEDTAGNKIQYFLTLQANQTFKVISKAPDGRTITSKGKISGKDTATSTDEMKDKTGKLLLTIINTYRKVPDEKKR
jgi:hypothetical protein